jgi:hypothetical protein
VARSLRAMAVGGAAATMATALFEWDLGRELSVPVGLLAAAPPVLYLVLALIFLRRAPGGQWLTWAVAACGVNAAIGLTTTLALSFSHPLSFEGAIMRAFGAFVPAPLIHLAAAPLVLMAVRPRVKLRRPVPRAREFTPRAPGPPLSVGTPNYDDVLRPYGVPEWAMAPGQAVFERARPELEPAPEPVIELDEPVVVEPPTPTHVPAFVASTPRVSSPDVPATPPPVAPPAPEEPMLRIAFERLAAQLPPDVFVLPPGRLGEGLREPYTLVVPQRLVVPQLREGVIEIPWTLIEDQFPDLALAMPRTEVRKRFPDWVLSLPLDEVLGQIPTELIRVAAPAADLSAIGSFPAPFKPGPPTPESEIEEPPVVVAREFAAAAPPPPIAAPAAVLTVPPTVATPLPESAPATEADSQPALAPPSSPPMPSHAPVATAPADGAPGASAPAEPRPVRRDEQLHMLARALAAVLAPAGALECAARRIDGRPLVSFAPAALEREAIDGLAARGLALLEGLAPWSVEQVTVRTSRLACVMVPLGAGGAVVAAVRRGTPLALLEVLTGRARGSASRTADHLTVPAAVSVTPVTEGNRRVSEAARALACFGALVPTEAAATRGAPGVYVFAARADANLAAAARVVHEGLVSGHEDGALGRLDSVTLRLGRERVIVRPLRLAAGTAALLAAAGEVALTGRAQRAAARAATLLEAR